MKSPIISSGTTWLTKENGFELLQEGSGDNKKPKISGPFIVMEKPNANGRIYGKEETVPAVEKYIDEFVKQDRALGEFNHPGLPKVNPERACMKIEDLFHDVDNNFYYGKAKLLSTTLGKMAQTLMFEDDVRLGVSSRMAGKSDPRTGRILPFPQLRVITASDLVHDPANSEAMVDIMMEQREFIGGNDDFTHMAFEQLGSDLESKGRTPVDEFITKFINALTIRV